MLGVTPTVSYNAVIELMVDGSENVALTIDISSSSLWRKNKQFHISVRQTGNK